MRRGVGSRRDRRAGPPSAASALGVSGGGCARSTKHAEKKRGWARVQRGVVARALPVADRRGHAPGGDRKPAALGGRRLVQVKYASCAAIAVRVPVHTSQPGKPDCCAERCPRRQDRARCVLRLSWRPAAGRAQHSSLGAAPLRVSTATASSSERNERDAKN